MSGAEGKTVWWAGITTVLPRGSVIPPATGWFRYRWNQVRWRLDRPRVFPWPALGRQDALAQARPPCTGLGDLICAWMMPMTLARLLGWTVRIPVPERAGGIHHDPGRSPLSPAWFRTHMRIPEGVELVATEAAPAGEPAFCTVEHQWHLNSCMETSYRTIPGWLRAEHAIAEEAYFEAYRAVGRSLLEPPSIAEVGEGPYLALHARRRDRGEPDDDGLVTVIARELARVAPRWMVVSDDPEARDRLAARLAASGCSVVHPPPPRREDAAELLVRDLRVLRGAAAVVSSVKGGWSALPYAATRMSGRPLLVASEPREARVWRLFRAYAHREPEGVLVGAGAAGSLARTLAGEGWIVR